MGDDRKAQQERLESLKAIREALLEDPKTAPLADKPIISQEIAGRELNLDKSSDDK